MEKNNELLNIRSKEIAVYFTNGTVQTVKDKEPFTILSDSNVVVFKNSSYIYTFERSSISGLGFKLISDKIDDTDDGK
jgi:hypothetical protein